MLWRSITKNSVAGRSFTSESTHLFSIPIKAVSTSEAVETKDLQVLEATNASTVLKSFDLMLLKSLRTSLAKVESDVRMVEMSEFTVVIVCCVNFATGNPLGNRIEIDKNLKAFGANSYIINCNKPRQGRSFSDGSGACDHDSIGSENCYRI
jgi:hypothetical protein